jgi:hypothetical protein
MSESLADQVARLLTASRAAHDRARQARVEKQAETATTELTAARDLRVQAHEADPDHTTPAWAAENPGHDAMMDFYTRKLGA